MSSNPNTPGNEQIKVTNFPPKPGPTIADLTAHVAGLAAEVGKPTPPTPHRDLLSRLLEAVGPVDFRAASGLEEDENLRGKHYTVGVVAEVLRLAALNRWNLCKRNDSVYLFNGAYWKQIERDTLKTFLGEAAARMGVPAADAAYYRNRDEYLNQFLTAAHLPEPQRAPDCVLINLQNGPLEIKPDGWNLRAPDAADFLTYQLPFAYQPNATAPTFAAYLDTVLPDEGLRGVLAEYLGYVFTRHLKLEKALFCYGTGANGKSVLFEIVNALLGPENVTSLSLSHLREEYNRAELSDKLLSYSSELDGGKLETALFKQLISGEPIQARRKYGHPFTLTDYAKLAFNANELPRDAEHSEAFFRRFLIVPFTVTIPTEQRDATLAGRIIAGELPGVFNWVLEGLRRLLAANGFTPCLAVSETLSAYKLESNSVAQFLDEEGYRPSPDRHQPLKELYAAYRLSCQQDGGRPVGRTNFSKRLKALGYQANKTNVGQVVYLSRDAC